MTIRALEFGTALEKAWHACEFQKTVRRAGRNAKHMPMMHPHSSHWKCVKTVVSSILHTLPFASVCLKYRSYLEALEP